MEGSHRCWWPSLKNIYYIRVSVDGYFSARNWFSPLQPPHSLSIVLGQYIKLDAPPT